MLSTPAGPVQGKMVLVAIDSHSRWIEAYPTESATLSVVVELSRVLFAQFGIPEVLVTDTGLCFVSEEFETFLAKNGIKHITSAPYHPATNVLVEWAVQTVKHGLKKETQGSMKERLAKVLMAYRTTPQSTTGMSPAQLLLGICIWTQLDLLIPNVSERVEYRQMQQKLHHDRSNPRKTFTKGEKVYARNFGTSTGQKWLPAVIQEVTGPVSFMVKLHDDRLVRRHLDHLLRRDDESTTQTSQSETVSEADIDNVLIGARLSSSSSSATPEIADSGSTEPVSDPTAHVNGESAQSTNIDGSTEVSTREQGVGTSSPSTNSNSGTQPSTATSGTKKLIQRGIKIPRHGITLNDYLCIHPRVRTVLNYVLICLIDCVLMFIVYVFPGYVCLLPPLFRGRKCDVSSLSFVHYYTIL